MPIYCLSTDGNPDGLERILLSFPKGTDMASAVQYVNHHYKCNARPIRLMEPTDNSVSVVIEQRKPKVVRVAAEAEDGDERVDEDNSDLEVAGVEGAPDDPSEITGGENDPHAP